MTNCKLCDHYRTCWLAGEFDNWAFDDKDCPEYTPRRRWIPCYERLPDKDGEYIVTLYLEYSKQFIVSLDVRFRNHRWEGARSPVVAWLPLPEPYEEGDNE